MTTAEDHAGQPPLAPGSWRTALRAWDWAFYLMVVATAVACWAAPLPPGDAERVVVALGVLVLAYLVLGRRAASHRDEWLGLAYLAIMLVVVGVLVSTTSIATLFLFAGYSQVWYLTERRWVGVVGTVLLSGVVVAGLLAREGTAPATVASVLAQVGLGMVFSLLLGLWIYTVVAQSQERAALIARLEQTQSELAAAHHADGVRAERERVAREIHDTLAQGFTSIVMLAQSAQADVDAAAAGPPGAVALGRTRERLALIERTARDNLAEARSLVAASAPTALQDGGLADALERTARRFTGETGVLVETDVADLGTGLDRETEVVLLRAAQEALANVRKHATGARRVRLSLTAADGRLTLEVTDDGEGIADHAASGFGLRGMQDRVAAGGGDVSVGPLPAGGTRLVVRLPDPRAARTAP